MANEIWHSSDEANTLYALIWRQTDDKVYDAVAGSDTFDTYTDADIGDYDIPLTNQADSDYHSVDFPSDISAGIYRVQVMFQIGGSPHADDDIASAQGEIYWDGSAEYNPSTITTVITNAHTTTDALITTVDTAVDAILVDTGTTLPAILATAQADLDTITGTNGATLSTASITALWAKTMSDLAAGAPSATASALTALNYLYEAWRNKVVTDGNTSEVIVYRDDGTTKLCESDIDHTGGVFTKGEFGVAD